MEEVDQGVRGDQEGKSLLSAARAPAPNHNQWLHAVRTNNSHVFQTWSDLYTGLSASSHRIDARVIEGIRQAMAGLQQA